MTEQRKKLINRFQSWLDTNPRKQIIAAVCTNIAEEYAKEQLLLHNVELLTEYEKFASGENYINSKPLIDKQIKEFIEVNCG